MAGLEIACPQCGQRLKLPDRSMLGRMGRCGKCNHRFPLIEAPEPEVSLQLARQEPSDDDTLIGVQARWVSEGAAGSRTPTKSPTAPSASAASPSPVINLNRTPAAVDDSNPLAAIASTVSSPAGSTSSPRRARRRSSGGWISMLIVLALVGGVGYGGYSYLASVKAPVTNQASAKGKSSKSKASPDHHAAAHKPDAADPASTIGTFTGESAGAPIDLLMMPNGAYAIIHIRPAELWAADSTGLEVVACLGPLGVWLKDKISTACLQDVAQIESATFGLIPSVKGQPPEVAVIVRTTNEIKRSELLDKFNGEQKDDLGRPYIQGETSAYLILDSRTYAVVPAALASEMVAAADNPPALQDSLQDLLFKSDRKQPVTIAFLPNAVRDDMFVLVPAPVQKLLNSVLDWLGDETEAAMWRVRVAPKFDSQLLVRNSTVISARKLAEGLQKKLAATPHELLSLVEQTHPRTVGSRKLVGRFPAMTQAFAKSTKIAHGPRLVAFNTELPERAGPNLAAAGLFTWDLTNQPDFGSGPKTAPQVAAEVALPAKLSDRLKKSISVDFRDEFLYSAIDFIGEETTVKFKLEGNDLKADGTTQNERQNLKMEGTAFAVLNTILSKKNLVMIIDEEKKLVTVTTAKAAAAKNLPVYPIEKELEKK